LSWQTKFKSWQNPKSKRSFGRTHKLSFFSLSFMLRAPSSGDGCNWLLVQSYIQLRSLNGRKSAAAANQPASQPLLPTDDKAGGGGGTGF
jgi:hypothetical protein